MKNKEILELAQKHGLSLSEDLKFNEMGIDFQVCFATDAQGKPWVLRIPRRSDLEDQIKKEKRILNLARKYLSIEVPDWKIATSNLVAYPLLKNIPALIFDDQTHQITFNMDKDSPEYIASLAKALVELHQITETDVSENNLKIMKSSDLRDEVQNMLSVVSSEIGISDELDKRFKKWLDNDPLWPTFTSFVHGDLYAGHILVTNSGTVTGVIDWSTAHIGDPSVDFSGHVNVFGEQSLKRLIDEYERHGGIIWDGLYEQAVERAAASPLAYGFFALETKDDNHINAAKIQLGVA
ncbi:macrolide 2'-phosphotransferase [Candidatus Dojkabacteria bacterium]|uniref:Macrolide 2'-phosphotransferase n=1 Tax=Candidatus Dojkabacteria bacterium TaxID=2099670 RepID=A0A5C7JBJ1_9BACT|nr:MAG: macrolide 2'-phosphotransferase [Candidatus Dojkabacteria bacterium]